MGLEVGTGFSNCQRLDDVIVDVFIWLVRVLARRDSVTLTMKGIEQVTVSSPNEGGLVAESSFHKRF